MRYLFTLTNLIFCMGYLSSQHATVPMHHHPHHVKSFCDPILNKSLAIRQREALQFKKWQYEQAQKSAPAIRTIPVVFHLLEYNPRITNDAVVNAVASLNNAFSHSNQYPNGADFSGEPVE